MNIAYMKSIHSHARQAQAIVAAEHAPTPPDLDRFRGTWKDHVSAAKHAFGLVSENELRRSHGHPENLKWLLQGHYTMAPRDAKVQVEKFIQKCGY